MLYCMWYDGNNNIWEARKYKAFTGQEAQVFHVG